jgi:hypothetical protein
VFALHGSPERPASSPAEGAVFADDNDFWRIGYEGTWITVRRIKGFVYLQYLLFHPDETVHVSHLVALGEPRWSGLPGGGIGTGGRDEPHTRSSGDTDSGDILDPRAKREYRARLIELKADLDEAVRWVDIERADSIRREIEFLSAQLARAFGLHGRARKMSDPMERVRKAVTNRIREAIERIAKQHPSLGRHLRNGIRTGFSCSYSPDSPVSWTSHSRPPGAGA